MSWQNHFLTALPPQEIRALAPLLERQYLERDQLLAAAHASVKAVYLPINCVISTVAVMSDGRSVETRTLGCESAFGLLHTLGSRISFERVTCQIAGEAWRAPMDRLSDLAQGSPALTRLIVQHAQATQLQAAQSTACNTLHTAEQRLCKWLLLTRERLGRDILPLTQEHLSIMLGVQRTTVTAIASELQARGLIAYARGKITILDRPALTRGACECYEAIERAGELMIRDSIPLRA